MFPAKPFIPPMHLDVLFVLLKKLVVCLILGLPIALVILGISALIKFFARKL